MKKIFLCLCAGAIFVFGGCACESANGDCPVPEQPAAETPEASPPVDHEPGDVTYADFFEMLEGGGFEPVDLTIVTHGRMSVGGKNIFVGNEMITVYEYDSPEAARIDAGFITSCGFGIEMPADGDEFQSVRISWISAPYWFLRDYIIVRYVGENEEIIRFLREYLGHNFAGYEAVTIEPETMSGFEITVPSSFAEAFAGVEDFGISFTGSVADWDEGWQGIPRGPDEVDFGTIYYRGEPIGLLRDETFLDLGIGNRFRISSENFAFEAPHRTAFVVRNEMGTIIGVNVMDCPGCGASLVCGDDPLADYFARVFAGAFPGVEELGVTFSVSREEWGNAESRFIYYQGEVIGRLIDDRRAFGGNNWIFTSACSDSTEIPNTRIYVIRDEAENITGLNVVE